MASLGSPMLDAITGAISKALVPPSLPPPTLDATSPPSKKPNPHRPPSFSPPPPIFLGVLYNQFLSQVDFEVLRDHARSLGVLMFENPPRRLMVVTPGGHPDVKRFWKRQKHSA